MKASCDVCGYDDVGDSPCCGFSPSLGHCAMCVIVRGIY
jgi:hypothetical protein